jgi:hypothetical protein
MHDRYHEMRLAGTDCGKDFRLHFTDHAHLTLEELKRSVAIVLEYEISPMDQLE